MSLATFKTWKHRFPAFLASLREAKSTADEFVEDALYRRACGYSHPEVKVFCDSKTGIITTHEVEKHYPPDATSMIFWLKNRQPKRWRERQEVAVDGITPFIIARRDGSTVELGATVAKEEE